MMSSVVQGWVVLAITMCLLWVRQLQTRDATTVDVAWSLGVGFLALWFAWQSTGDPVRRGVVATIAVLWALRLATYLLRDRVLGRTVEDGRYRYLREHWGRRAPIGFFYFYQAQALFAVIFALPLFAAVQGGPLGAIAGVGVLVWAISVVGETVADRQLARFRGEASNRGLVCEVGLWRYSRHPNYFFEWLHWWAYVLISGGALLSWVGPVAMLLFLFRLTGIPHTEAQALRSRGDAYRRYQHTTSIFIPWFRRSA